MTAPSVPEDPVLPRFAETLNPAAMLSLFRREVPSALGYEIKGCTVDRIRYRRGARAVVQYTARLENPSTGSRRDQWITALLYPPRRVGQVQRKLRKAFAAVSGLRTILPPVAFASDSGLILQTFPFDRRLPSLPRLANPSLLGPGLPSEGAERGIWTSEPVRYRAGLGCALRWHQASDSNGGHTWYVKAYRDDQGASTQEVLLRLRTARRDEGFAVPEPVAYLDDQRALVQDEVKGRPLAEVLLLGDDPAATMALVGGALATFHHAPPITSRLRGPADQLADVGRACALISWVRPSLADAAEAVKRRVADRLGDVEPAAIHGDLKPDHVVLAGDRMTLLDLDSFVGGDPVVDTASMLARLDGMVLRHPAAEERIEGAQRTFVETYFAHVPAHWRGRLPAHHSGALLQEAAGSFRNQLSDWPDLMDALVQRAADAVAS